MGLFNKSLVIVLIAISMPLVYRQFADDNTVKFMSKYYSNYKSIDRFLKQSANHIESAKEYLPDSQQVKGVVNQFNSRLNSIINEAKSKLATQQEDKSSPKAGASRDKLEERPTARKHVPTTKIVRCPGEAEDSRLWTKQELAEYDGNLRDDKIYLAFLGLVYDVSGNLQHYGGGAEYNAFAGKDATKAFVTGNFTHDLHDNISDIDTSLYSHIQGWSSFYNSSYPILGKLEGNFYNLAGCPTDELLRVFRVFDELEQEKTDVQQSEREFPECNSEWNSDLKKGRVWCSTKSGGVEREWIGVPRIFNDGSAQRCACFNKDAPDSSIAEKFMSKYPGCDDQATECPLT